MAPILITGLIGFAVVFVVLAVWALVGNTVGTGQRVRLRLQGVRQIKEYELGDTLAASDRRKKRAKDKRREVMRKKAFSDIPVLQKRFGGEPWAEGLGAKLRQLNLPLTVTSFLLMSAACGALGALFTIAGFGRFHVVVTPVVFTALAVTPYLCVGVAVGTRIRKFNIQFADALDLLSSSVRSGLSLNSAVQNVADEMPEPVGEEFKTLADELSFGLELADGLRHLQHRMNTPDVQFFATALMIQKETGGNLSEVLDGLQKTIRERFRILRHVRSLTAQGRLSGWILGILPVALAIIISFTNWNYMKLLFTTDTGHKLLIAAGGFQLVGILVIRKIVNVKV